MWSRAKRKQTTVLDTSGRIEKCLLLGFTHGEDTWLPVAEDFELNNVQQQQASVRSHFQVYRALTALRHRPAFRFGRYESLALSHDVYGFKRYVIISSSIEFGKIE